MNKAQFFDLVRKSTMFNGKLSDEQVEGIEAILDAATAAGWSMAWKAYALATAYHETAKTMQPIPEYGNNNYFENNYGCNGKDPKRAKANGNIHVGDGIKYRGRGFVQLTWRNNYIRASTEIGVNLRDNPDLALNIGVATKILIWGMQGGKFTGKSLGQCLGSKATIEDFKEARKIINGTDKALLIAGYAMKFQTAMQLAGAT